MAVLLIALILAPYRYRRKGTGARRVARDAGMVNALWGPRFSYIGTEAGSKAPAMT
jgi:hypothetical protein